MEGEVCEQVERGEAKATTKQRMRERTFALGIRGVLACTRNTVPKGSSIVIVIVDKLGKEICHQLPSKHEEKEKGKKRAKGEKERVKQNIEKKARARFFSTHSQVDAAKRVRATRGSFPSARVRRRRRERERREGEKENKK